MKTGWIVYNKEDAEKNLTFVRLFFEECEKRGIQLILVYEDETEARLQFKSYPDFVICRMRKPLLTKILEDSGIPCFNAYAVSILGNHKGAAYHYYESNGIEIMKTVTIRSGEYCPDGLFAESEYPLVLKSCSGHGGTEVFLAKSIEQVNKIAESLLSQDYVIQQCSDSPGKDVRVYVLGNDILAAVLRTSKSDFRSNYSLGGEACMYHLSAEEIRGVRRIISLTPGIGLVGIDFIFNRGKLIFNELEDVVGCRMLYNMASIDVVNRYMELICQIVYKL